MQVLVWTSLHLAPSAQYAIAEQVSDTAMVHTMLVWLDGIEGPIFYYSIISRTN